MSEEHRITKVEKEKDPRRVEAGKRLGAISRAAKDRKELERSHAEDKDTMSDTENSETSYMSVIAGVGVLTGLVCLYFTYKQDKRAEVEPNVSHPVRQNLPVGPPVDNKLRSLD